MSEWEKKRSSSLDYLSDSPVSHHRNGCYLFRWEKIMKKINTCSRDKSGALKCQQQVVTLAQSAKRPHERRPSATSTFSYLLPRRLSKCDPSDINFKRAVNEGRQAALPLFLPLLHFCRSVFHILMDPASPSGKLNKVLASICSFPDFSETVFSPAWHSNNPLQLLSVWR